MSWSSNPLTESVATDSFKPAAFLIAAVRLYTVLVQAVTADARKESSTHVKRSGGREADDGAEPVPPLLPACDWLSCPSLLRGRLLPCWLVAAAALILRGGLAKLCYTLG